MSSTSNLANASLSALERRLVGRFVELMRTELGEDLRGVWLYGSRARGERHGRDSDVDVLVVTRSGRRDLQRIYDLLEAAGQAEGVDPYVIAPFIARPGWIEDRRAIGSFFIQEVDRDKVVLAGEP